MLASVASFFFFCFVFAVSSFLIWTSTPQLVFFDFWQLNAVHALHCLYFFPKELYCGLNCEVYWSVQTFFFFLVFLFPLFCAIVLCPYCGLTPHVVHCVLCTLKSVVASKETKNNKKKKSYFYSFIVRSQQILFFQHNAFWTIVLKKSILIFTCYMTCRYL